MKISRFQNIWFVLCAGFMVYLIGGFPALLFALPAGGTIVSGTGTIHEPTPGNVEIHQSTPRLIINWQGYNIGSGESVQYFQPGTGSVVLNRVVGGNPSVINGLLSANGQVFITNPSGVLFGAGARVNVHGLLATTLKISDQDFLNGNYNFFQDPSRPLASILNEGVIDASGYAALLAPAVDNQGTIVANLGSVALASGTAATLDFTGDGLINFALTDDVYGTVVDADGNVVKDRVNNAGFIRADGGLVTLSARDAGEIIRNVVNNTGVIEARTVFAKAGRIFLTGGDMGIVKVAGLLDASGKDAGETGGTVHVLGEKVALAGNGRVDVSGDAGGGTALIGGDLQGQGSVPTAFRTYVGQDASITADALTSGDGGKVIVWSDDITRFNGSISATGGAESGNGGFVEVSGKELLYQGNIDAAASNGEGGTVLFDPITITVQLTNPIVNPIPPSHFVLFGDNPGASVTFDPGQITAITNTGAAVFFQSLGDIIINDPINTNNPAGPGGAMTFQAAGNFVVNAGGGITTDDAPLLITATDYLLGGPLNSGTNFMRMVNNGGTIGLGNATCGGACVTSLSGADLQNLTTPNLFLGDGGAGSAFIDGVTAANTANIGRILLTTGNAVQVLGGASAFTGRMDMIANNGITVATAMQTMGPLGFSGIADADGNGVGDFNVTAAGSLMSNNARITLRGNDMILDGAVNAGTDEIRLFVSDSGSIGLGTATAGAGFGVDLAEFGRMTAGFFTVGNDPASPILVDGLNLGASNLSLIGNAINDQNDDPVDAVVTTGALILTANGPIGNLNGPQGLNVDVGQLFFANPPNTNFTMTHRNTLAADFNFGADNTGGTGDINFTLTQGNLLLQQVTTLGNVNLTATNGAIVDANDPAGGNPINNITANSATLTGGTNIGVPNPIEIITDPAFPPNFNAPQVQGDPPPPPPSPVTQEFINNAIAVTNNTETTLSAPGGC